MGLDVFHFQPTPAHEYSQFSSSDFFQFSTGVMGVSFDVLRLRLTLLTSERYPKGQLQPYFTIGPTVFRTHMKEFSQSVADTSVGFKIGAGLACQVTRWLSLFGEGRYLRFNAQTRSQDSALVQENGKTGFATLQLIGGVSFRF